MLLGVVRPLVITVFLTGFAPRARAANVTVLVKPGVPMYRPGQKKVHGMLEFPTIQNALDHAPQPTNGGRVVIRITPGCITSGFGWRWGGRGGITRG
jgi:pectin methylesterase-like acyl-CoA thioesterase